MGKWPPRDDKRVPHVVSDPDLGNEDPVGSLSPQAPGRNKDMRGLEGFRDCLFCFFISKVKVIGTEFQRFVLARAQRVS